MKMISYARVLSILTLCQATHGFAADWVVQKVSQPSRYTTDNRTWQVLKQGMSLPNESWISTGPRGRVVLQRARDQVTFQPGTLAGIFEKAGMAIHTDFAQQTGTLMLDIDPQVKPHLAVQTPYLAAVVKGTRFSVSVNGSGASVGVERGRVEVTDARSGERTGVRAGQQAAVDNNPATAMELSGVNTQFETISKVAPFAAMVPAAATTPAVSNETTSGVSNGPAADGSGAAAPGPAGAAGTGAGASDSASGNSHADGQEGGHAGHGDADHSDHSDSGHEVGSGKEGHEGDNRTGENGGKGGDGEDGKDGGTGHGDGHHGGNGHEHGHDD
nr:FecR domain-containing protein [uncultured Gellertiella sp.]